LNRLSWEGYEMSSRGFEIKVPGVDFVGMCLIYSPPYIYVREL